MAQLVLTYPTVTDGVTIVDAVIHNTNWSQCVAAVNGIDHGNIGAAGLYASNLLPTTAAQATFGATATGVGYKFLANDTTATPLTISGVTSQSADIFDVTLTSGGTKAFVVGANGVSYFSNAGASVSGPGGITAGDLVVQRNASAGTLWLGGGTKAGALDYQVTATGFHTFSGSATYNGVQVVDGLLVATAGSTYSAVGGAVPGDLVGQRTASGGVLFLGGVTHAGQMDYGVTTAQTFTLVQAVNMSSTLSVNGGLTAATGDVGLGRSTTTGALFFGSTGASSAGYIDFGVTNAGQFSMRLQNSTYSQVNGAAYNNLSDGTFKTNVAPITRALETLSQLKPSSFNWKSTDQADMGFIAQDVLPVLPQLTRTDSDGVMGLVYTGFTALAIASIQEMIAKLKAAGIAGF